MKTNQSLSGFISALMSSLALFSNKNQSNCFINFASYIGCLNSTNGSHGFYVYFGGGDLGLTGDQIDLFFLGFFQITFDQNISYVRISCFGILKLLLKNLLLISSLSESITTFGLVGLFINIYVE